MTSGVRGPPVAPTDRDATEDVREGMALAFRLLPSVEPIEVGERRQ